MENNSLASANGSFHGNINFDSNCTRDATPKMKGSGIDYVACTPEIFTALLSLKVLETRDSTDAF